MIQWLGKKASKLLPWPVLALAGLSVCQIEGNEQGHLFFEFYKMAFLTFLFYFNSYQLF